MGRVLATGANQSDNGDPGRKWAVGGDLRRWIIEHLPSGSVLLLGGAASPFPLNAPDHTVVDMRHLASTADTAATVDHAWVNDALDPAKDPATVVQRVFQTIKPGGTLVVTVPFGLSRGVSDTPGFYLGSLRRLLEPLFEIAEPELIDGQIAVAGVRRQQPAGVPVFSLDPEETAFSGLDRRLNERLRLEALENVHAAARYAAAKTEVEGLQAELKTTKGDLVAVRRKLAMIRPLLAAPLAVVRGGRRLKRGAARRGRVAVTFMRGAGAPAQRATGQRVPAAAGKATAPPNWRETLVQDFNTWLRAARDAEGDEIVVMFSGTTFVQEHRGNRPIRLTNVYLRRKCPVFFNYYRSNYKQPLPEHPDELLFQSPIDATPELFDALLTADFGDKKKIFYASFPHELMVRHLTVAAMHGWVTVYDARDDWEEFAKVGMAKWYHPGYERYVASHADIATAVSRPLARKMSAIADREVHVVANALDTRFPQASRSTEPTWPPVIGYFGHLTDKWFDWPLVIAAAERYPGYTFELAGHQQPEMEYPPNIKLLGLVGHQDLADRSRTWSLALIPFKNGPLADSVDPIKVYEYLHLRLPVLATYFPQCREYPGTTITEGREEFLELLPRLVGTVVPEKETAEWLTHNTWERRVDRYSELADEVRARGRDGVMALLGAKW
ncbi:hypothetical protein GCM10009658_07800 [Planotetraspora silvatica]